MRPCRLWADSDGLEFTVESARTVGPLFDEHYLGPLRAGRHAFGGWRGCEMVAGMVWRLPVARMLPSDGSWLELGRWCLTPEAGSNAGSRMMAWVVRWLRENDQAVQVLVSYSDPSHGHTGALYKACNWEWAPTWHRLSPPPTGNGNWGGKSPQAIKDRWVYHL
jgi:hypothetical protein